MIFTIDELTVFFPFESIYPEQFAYMVDLKASLDAGGTAVLEMASGTGKTVTLLSLILSYKHAHGRGSIGPLIYCSRTTPEVEKVLIEAKRVVSYIEEATREAGKLLVLGLASRKHLCVHPRVSKERWASRVDAECRNLTASFVRDAAEEDETVETCGFYTSFQEDGRAYVPRGVFALDDLREFGQEKGWCPYFVARNAVQSADVIVHSFQYVLDPKVSALIGKELRSNSILVFDEAHNIDDVCIDALSVHIDRRTADAAVNNVNRLETVLRTARQKSESRLQEEYQRLVEGLGTQPGSTADLLAASSVLSQDEVQEAVPGNIRKGEHFLSLLRRLTEHMRNQLLTNRASMETPLSWLHGASQSASLDSRSLRHASRRLQSLIHTLEIRDVDALAPLNLVAEFASLVASYKSGFLVLLEPADPTAPTAKHAILQLACLDASLAMQPVLKKYDRIVITSGTLSPLDMYPRILSFQPVIAKSYAMTLPRPCVTPLVVTRGSDQTTISSQYELRSDPGVIRNYGQLLVEFSSIIPDGIVVFFPSYLYMEQVIGQWSELGILTRVQENKLMFAETPDAAESTLALVNFRTACDIGRGAVFLGVARGKVSEGIDFDGHYGRCIMLIGIPYVYTESRVLRARLEYMRQNFGIRENEFLTFDAIRNSSQCIGRGIRGKSDYSVIVLADSRYARMDKLKKLPGWLQQHLTGGTTDLSTDEALAVAKQFLREAAQPFELGKEALWTLEDVVQHPNGGVPGDDEVEQDPMEV